MHYFSHADIPCPTDPEKEPMHHVTALYDGKKLQGMPEDDKVRALWHAAEWSVLYSLKG